MKKTPEPVAQLTVVEHPLVRHKVTLLRDQRTDTPTFRHLAGEIATLLAYEATRDLELESVDVATPIETTTGERLRGPGVVLVPILRAGLGLLDPLLTLLPHARVGFIGLRRDEHTHQPETYYEKLPEGLDTRRVLLLDPMLATGGSATAACSILRAAGAARITLVCLVAAPEGVATLAEHHPEVAVVTAALDRQLTSAAYIAPGLGDAGDRLFGTH